MRPPLAGRPGWALTGAAGRDKNTIIPFRMQAEDLEQLNFELQGKIAGIAHDEVRYIEHGISDPGKPAELIVVAFGTAGRIALSAVKAARQKGIRAGLHRPITLSPFPDRRLSQLADDARGFLVVEMNAGQMLEDVRLAVGGQAPVRFLGRMGGTVPMTDEILAEIETLDQTVAWTNGDHKIEGPIALRPMNGPRAHSPAR
jgi:2-oxoglutarate ferredoxin oxidoreductase subunit alpha